jgi:hypothetical protein
LGGLLYRVGVGNVANVSDVNTASIFRVEVCKLGEFLCLKTGTDPCSSFLRYFSTRAVKDVTTASFHILTSASEFDAYAKSWFNKNRSYWTLQNVAVGTVSLSYGRTNTCASGMHYKYTASETQSLVLDFEV